MKKLFILAVVTLPWGADAHELVTRIIDTDAGHASVTSIPGGHYMVFDAGRYEHREHILKQIREIVLGGRIDLMVISHTDGDHLGAVSAILDEFDVTTVLRLGWERCDSDDPCAWYYADQAIRRAADADGLEDINLTVLDEDYIGHVFELGDARATVLSAFPIPPANWGLTYNSSDWRNAGSIVIRLEYHGRSILFTGDTWGRDDTVSHGGAEKFMVQNAADNPIAADVMIAPHHGADDGSSAEFVEAVSPSWVVFPSGGRYQHPRWTTVARYKAAGVPERRMLRTDLCDRPGPKEWFWRQVDGIDDDAGDNDIDIRLSDTGIVSVRYVALDKDGC